MSPASRRPVRVAGASGGFSDRVRAISSLAKNEEVDVIVGDWLSEMTMTIHGTGKIKNMEQMMKMRTLEEKLDYAMFAENFLDCFLPAVPDLATKGIKLAVNAGASDTELLAQLIDKKVKGMGYKLKIAWIEGDDVTGAVKGMLNKGEGFRSLMHNKSVQEWGLDPVCAQCYLGGMGIARALTEGADVVICGRVSDASPIIGAAAWWHGWTADMFDELAGSLVIGMLSPNTSIARSSNYTNKSRPPPRVLLLRRRRLLCRLPLPLRRRQTPQHRLPHLRNRQQR
jgi:hypothetical protein